jgi:malonate transporter MadL subunit
MIIYGVALLSGCLLVGMLTGEVLGVVLGVSANVGGVGIAMLLLAGVQFDKIAVPRRRSEGFRRRC